MLLVLALQALPLASGLEYRRAWLGEAPWRLLSAHWVHLSWPHALVNALALGLIAEVFSPWLSGRRLLSLLVGASLFISVTLYFAWPSIAWYRGLSGALNAAFVAGCVLWLASPRRYGRLLPALLLAGVAIKNLIERSWTDHLPVADWLGGQVVPQAHLAGALFGLAAGLLLAGAQRTQGRRQPQAANSSSNTLQDSAPPPPPPLEKPTDGSSTSP